MLQLLFFILRSGRCTKHDVNIAVEISILESDVKITCIHIFLILQVLISNVATIIYQCCDGRTK
jgi:hypothetical protein